MYIPMFVSIGERYPLDKESRNREVSIKGHVILLSESINLRVGFLRDILQGVCSRRGDEGDAVHESPR